LNQPSMKKAKVASLDSPAIWIVRQCPETPKGQFTAEICYLTQGQIIVPGWWWLEPWNGFHDFPETVGNEKSSQLTNSLHHFSEG
jgi:hypothetical protein